MNYRRMIINVICFDDEYRYFKFDLNVDDPSTDVGVVFFSYNDYLVLGLFHDGVYYLTDQDYSGYYVWMNAENADSFTSPTLAEYVAYFVELTKLWDGEWHNPRGRLPRRYRVAPMCDII